MRDVPRRESTRRALVILAAALIAAATGFGTTALSESQSGGPLVGGIALHLPSTYRFVSMLQVPGAGPYESTTEVVLSGVSQHDANRCVRAWVSASLAPRLRLDSVTSQPCEGWGPAVTIGTFAGTLSGDDADYTASIRVLLLDPSAGVLWLGPTVMRFGPASDTQLATATSGTSLWIYDCNTPSGAELLRVSTSTGAVLNAVPMPVICRPTTWATRSGFLLEPNNESGWGGNPVLGLYSVAPGADRPTLIRRCTHASATWTC